MIAPPSLLLPALLLLSPPTRAGRPRRREPSPPPPTAFVAMAEAVAAFAPPSVLPPPRLRRVQPACRPNAIPPLPPPPTSRRGGGVLAVPASSADDGDRGGPADERDGGYPPPRNHRRGGAPPAAFPDPSPPLAASTSEASASAAGGRRLPGAADASGGKAPAGDDAVGARARERRRGAAGGPPTSWDSAVPVAGRVRRSVGATAALGREGRPGAGAGVGGGADGSDDDGAGADGGGSVDSLIRSLVGRGELSGEELSDGCVGALRAAPFDLAREAVMEYLLQKRKRQRNGAGSGLGPIRNPGGYVLAIMRSLSQDIDTAAESPVLSSEPGAAHMANLQEKESIECWGPSTANGATSDELSVAKGSYNEVSLPPEREAEKGRPCQSPPGTQSVGVWMDNLSETQPEMDADAPPQSEVRRLGTVFESPSSPTSSPVASSENGADVEQAFSQRDDAPSPARLVARPQTPSSLPVDGETVGRCLSLLQRLEQPVTSLRGVGPKTAEAFDRLGLTTVRSLLWHFPASFVDRTHLCPDVGAAEDGSVCTAVLTVQSAYQGRRVFRVNCLDGSGNAVSLVYFHSPSGRGRQIVAAAKRAAGGAGGARVVSGRVKRAASGVVEIVNPDFVKPVSELENVARVEPVYKLSKGLSKAKMAGAIDEALRMGQELLRCLPESLPQPVLADLSWPTLADSLLLSHRPTDPSKAGAGSPARMRLAFEEMCIQQATLGLTRWRYKNPYGTPDAFRFANDAHMFSLWRDSPLVSSAVAALPFDLTSAQEDCLAEAWADSVATTSRDGNRMARLMQGDVGSGKTVVAYLLGLGCLESEALGNTVAFLAPTTLLAQQHYRSFMGYIEGLYKNDAFSGSTIKDIHVVLITGSVIGQSREALLKRLELCGEHEAFFLIGTHALLTPEVASRLAHLRRRSGASMPGLALAIVDEEQRFGVQQRDILASSSSHTLYMSATPIPRTLALGSSTLASTHGPRTGSLDTSCLDSKPDSARRVKTSLVDINRVDEIIQGIERQISIGDKVFWILPLIGEEIDEEVNEDKVEFERNCVISRYESLSKFLGDGRVGMVHGRMQASEREEQLKEFAEPTSQVAVLVGTTVLEVGIDIPAVTILVVEEAERFGLSQLHQLRGRVGRAGSHRADVECHCILLTDVFDRRNNKVDAMRRLDILRRTDDGFQVALSDLSLRGPGEVLGLKQSGLKNGFTVDMLAHFGMLAAASSFGRFFLEGGDTKPSPSEVDPKAQFGGAAEGQLLERFYGRLQPFYSDSRASTQSGFALRVCLCLFGTWTGATDGSSTWPALLTLRHVSCSNWELTEADQTIENNFASFAESIFGDSLTLQNYIFPQRIGLMPKHTPLSSFFSTEDGISSMQVMEHRIAKHETSPAKEHSLYSINTEKPVISREPVFLLLDVETTGLSPRSSYIIQLAAKVLGDDEVFSEYILPPICVSTKIEELTGITNTFLHHGGVDSVTGIQYAGPAGDFSQAYHHFCEFVSRKAQQQKVCLVAHNAAFDLRMLNAEIKRLATTTRLNGNCGMDIPDLKSVGITTSLDTLGLLRTKKLWSHSGLSVPPSFGLADIYRHVHQKNMDAEHNAVGDVNALEDILLSPWLEGWKVFGSQMQTPIISLPAKDKKYEDK